MQASVRVERHFGPRLVAHDQWRLCGGCQPVVQGQTLQWAAVEHVGSGPTVQLLFASFFFDKVRKTSWLLISFPYFGTEKQWEIENEFTWVQFMELECLGYCGTAVEA